MTEDELRRRTREYVGRLSAQSARAVTDHKIVEGIGSRTGEGTRLPTSENAVRVVQSTDALYGRVAARLGPVPNFISTHPLRGLIVGRVRLITTFDVRPAPSLVVSVSSPSAATLTASGLSPWIPSRSDGSQAPASGFQRRWARSPSAVTVITR